MVPHLLRLRNFMSYGDEPVIVDFTGVHLACLSGGNGNGKSALLDAITWALWGESRARREDDLVYRGATTMEVELEFSVGAGRYRVIRKRTLRPNSPSAASLELQTQGEGGFTSITGGTIRETEARLLDILKLSYKTFINSAFLLQGRADTFTSSTPTERKGVLGEILGLEQYDKLVEEARRASRDRAVEAANLRARIAADEAEVARRPALRAELMEREAEREEAIAAVRAADEALWAANAELQGLQARAHDLERVQQTIDALDRELATLARRHDEALRVARDAEALLAREGEITAGVAESRRAREELGEMGERAGRVVALEREAEGIRRAIEAEKARLDGEARSARAEAERYARIVAGAEALRRQVEEYARDEASIGGLEEEREDIAREVESVRGLIVAVQGENAGLEGEMKPLRERLKLLQEEGAACPVCLKPMSDEERRRLYEEFKEEGVAKKARVKANDDKVAGLNEQLRRLRDRDVILAATLAPLRKRANELAALRQRLLGADEAAAMEREARARFEVARRALEGGDYAHEARVRLAAAEDAVRAVGYDAARHAALQSRTRELASVEAEAAALATARERHDNARATIRATEGDMARRRGEKEQAEGLAATLLGVRAELPRAEARKGECEAAVRAKRGREGDLIRLIAELNGRLVDLDKKEEGLRAERAMLANLDRESDAYKELADAFGKAGIQAMIIDNALPELESSANAILARMSDMGMQVRFSTQRESVKKDVIETLDISIADANGTRPYEMYSGGEAFRVNFAVRIALSRLLAERAGAQLQLLVIDEGFGTQDSQGRERIVEAINGVAADFERILIVTHIDELKDLFSTRIDVVKDVDGSRVTVTAA